MNTFNKKEMSFNITKIFFNYSSALLIIFLKKCVLVIRGKYDRRKRKF